MTTEQTFTPPQLAKRWRCSPDRVRDLIRDGKLDAFNLADPGTRAQYRIPPEAVQRFERARAASASPAPAPRSSRRPRLRDVESFV